MWMVNHPNETPTIDVLERDPTFNVPRPPEGFHWEINESNEPVLVEEDISHVRGVPVSPNMP
jgi:hypothetical protein